jgi:hypothetical protein
MRATDLLRQDHEHVQALFQRLEAAGPGDERQSLLDEIADELEVHAQIEEEIFYPAAREVSARVDDHVAGHQHLRSVIGQTQGHDPASAEFLRGALLIRQVVVTHVAEEEGGLFLDAARLGPEALERLGARMEERKQTLKTSPVQRGARKLEQAPRKAA